MKTRIRRRLGTLKAHVRPWLALVICLGLLGAPYLASQASAASPTVFWMIETLDGPDQVGYYTSIALDGDDHPHISHYDSSGQNLKYTYWDGAAWHTTTVDSTGEVGKYTSIALDSNGYPHISYFDDDADSLKYAYQDGDGWHTETVPRGGAVTVVHGYTAIALDTSDQPHISYYTGDLEHAYKDGGGWHVEVLDSAGWVGKFTSIALDGSDYPHISYYDVDKQDLKYAYQDASGWYTETVDSDGVYTGQGTSIALPAGGSDTPHIGYYGNGTLRYAHLDASGWHTETVDAPGVAGWYPSLALDAGGYPHISYYSNYDLTNQNLKYAYQDGAGWHVETVDSVGDVGYHTSIALDGNNRPHISYQDVTNYDLKHAYLTTQLPPPPPATRYVDPAGACNGLAPCHTTIGAAVAASGPGEVIYIFSGTYAESVDLSTMATPGRISFVAVNAAGVPKPGTVTVDPGATGGPGTGPAFRHTTSPFPGDVAFHGLVVDSPDVDGIDLTVSSDVVIDSVTANATNGDGVDATAQTGNIFVANSTANDNVGWGDGFDLSAEGNVVVVSSVANGNQSDGFEIEADGNLTIGDATANDHADDYGDGFDLQVGGDLRINRATASGNHDDGMDLWGRTPDRVTIQDSVFQDNDSAGVELQDLPSALAFQVRGSIICGNGTGLRLDAAINLDAEGNWWGQATGPTHPGNAGGSGDAVVDGANGGAGTVDYAPWIDAISASASVDPVSMGQPTVISFQFSGGGGAFFLGPGPGDLNGTPLFNLTTDNGSLTSSTGTGATVAEFVNNANGTLSVTLIPSAASTATVTLDGPCNLDGNIAVSVEDAPYKLYLPLVLR